MTARTEEDDARRESRLRSKLGRQGYTLRKARTRDQSAAEFARFHIVDAVTNAIVAGTSSPLDYTMTLDDVEDFANDEHPGRTEGWIEHLTAE